MLIRRNYPVNALFDMNYIIEIFLFLLLKDFNTTRKYFAKIILPIEKQLLHKNNLIFTDFLLSKDVVSFQQLFTNMLCDVGRKNLTIHINVYLHFLVSKNTGR